MLGRDSRTHANRNQNSSSGDLGTNVATLLIAAVFVLAPIGVLIATTILALAQGSILHSTIQTFSSLQSVLIIVAFALLMAIFVAIGISLARWLYARNARAIAYGRLLQAYESSRRETQARSGTSAEYVTIVDAAPYSEAQLVKALSELDRILEQNQEDVDAWVNKGAVLFELGRYESALEALDSALALDRTHAMAWAVRGKTLLHMGQHRKAAKSLVRALKLDPLNAGAREDLEDARHRRTPQHA